MQYLFLALAPLSALPVLWTAWHFLTLDKAKLPRRQPRRPALVQLCAALMCLVSSAIGAMDLDADTCVALNWLAEVPFLLVVTSLLLHPLTRSADYLRRRAGRRPAADLHSTATRTLYPTRAFKAGERERLRAAHDMRMRIDEPLQQGRGRSDASDMSDGAGHPRTGSAKAARKPSSLKEARGKTGSGASGSTSGRSSGVSPRPTREPGTARSPPVRRTDGDKQKLVVSALVVAAVAVLALLAIETDYYPPYTRTFEYRDATRDGAVELHTACERVGWPWVMLTGIHAALVLLCIAVTYATRDPALYAEWQTLDHKACGVFGAVLAVWFVAVMGMPANAPLFNCLGYWVMAMMLTLAFPTSKALLQRNDTGCVPDTLREYPTLLLYDPRTRRSSNPDEDSGNEPSTSASRRSTAAAGASSRLAPPTVRSGATHEARTTSAESAGVMHPETEESMKAREVSASSKAAALSVCSCMPGYSGTNMTCAVCGGANPAAFAWNNASSTGRSVGADQRTDSKHSSDVKVDIERRDTGFGVSGVSGSGEAVAHPNASRDVAAARLLGVDPTGANSSREPSRSGLVPGVGGAPTVLYASDAEDEAIDDGSRSRTRPTLELPRPVHTTTDAAYMVLDPYAETQSFHGVELTREGTAKLAFGIESNEYCRVLDLSHCGITDSQLRVLIPAIMANRSIIRLDLNHNRFTYRSARLLLHSLRIRAKVMAADARAAETRAAGRRSTQPRHYGSVAATLAAGNGHDTVSAGAMDIDLRGITLGVAGIAVYLENEEAVRDEQRRRGTTYVPRQDTFRGGASPNSPSLRQGSRLPAAAAPTRARANAATSRRLWNVQAHFSDFEKLTARLPVVEFASFLADILQLITVNIGANAALWASSDGGDTYKWTIALQTPFASAVDPRVLLGVAFVLGFPMCLAFVPRPPSCRSASERHSGSGSEFASVSPTETWGMLWFKASNGISEAMWKVVSACSLVCSMFLFIPMWTLLISVFRCTTVTDAELESTASVVALLPDVQCWSGTHFAWLIPSTVLAVALAFFGSRLYFVGGSLDCTFPKNPEQSFSYFGWGDDQRFSENPNFESPLQWLNRRRWRDGLMILARMALAVVTAFVGDASVAATALLFGLTGVYAFHSWLPVYAVDLMNHLAFALAAAAVWTNGCALALLLTSKVWALPLTVALFAGVVAVFLVALLLHAKLCTVDLTSESAQLEEARCAREYAKAFGCDAPPAMDAPPPPRADAVKPKVPPLPPLASRQPSTRAQRVQPPIATARPSTNAGAVVARLPYHKAMKADVVSADTDLHTVDVDSKTAEPDGQSDRRTDGGGSGSGSGTDADADADIPVTIAVDPEALPPPPTPPTGWHANYQQTDSTGEANDEDSGDDGEQAPPPPPPIDDDDDRRRFAAAHL